VINLRLIWNLISCSWTHPKNMPKVWLPHLQLPDGSRKILEPFDLLLFHGHTLLNKAIQACTDSKYNHAALYIGGKLYKRGAGIGNVDRYDYEVLHAIGKGLLRQTIREAWADSDKFISVYRYKKRITFEQRDKLTETANKYLNAPERYSVEALLCLAFASQLRADSNFISRKLVDATFQSINDAFEDGKEPVDCSEIAYRIFDESGLPIRILPEGLHEEFNNTDNIDILDFMARKDNMFKVSADFVTPHDLSMSPDFGYVGDLVKEF
jgi:hypothetical protein